MTRFTPRAIGMACAALVLSAGLAGCSNANGSPAGDPGTSSAGATTASAAGKQVAYLSFAVVNVYDKPIQAQAQKAADAAGVKMTVFDANADGGTQYSQLQNVITSGKYQGVVIQAVQSTNLIPLIEQAVSKGIGVVVLDQVVGPDLSTNEPQVDGIVASVAIPPVQVGQRLGKLAIQACTTDSCVAGFIYGYKGSVTDNGLAEGFKSAISGSKVTLGVEGQGLYTTQGGLQAAQNMLTSTPDLSILIGADQSLQGAEQAVASAGKTGKIAIIGYDGQTPALNKIKAGEWFGDVQYPQNTEGKLAMEAMVDWLATGKKAGAVNVLDMLPHDDLITKDTVDDFTSQDQ